jgi:hypothetical protein
LLPRAVQTFSERGMHSCLMPKVQDLYLGRVRQNPVAHMKW